MRTNYLFVLFLLFSFACNKHLNKEPLPEKGVLWKISGNGLKAPSYLLGTLHVQGAMQILDSIPEIDSIFNSSHQLICESVPDFTNIFKPKDTSNIKKQMSFLKPWPDSDSTYESLLSGKQKYIFDSVINTHKFLEWIIETNVRPLGLINLIKYSHNEIYGESANQALNQKQGVDSAKLWIIDFYLQYEAKNLNKNIVELDTPLEYQKVLDSIAGCIPTLSYKSEVDVLIYFAENHQKVETEKGKFINEVLQTYLQQNIALIAQQQLDYKMQDNEYLQYLGLKKFADIYKQMIVDERNDLWMNKIPGLIEQNESFIAVGAAHLVGENGLINQLRDLNYTVTRVKGANEE